MISNLNQYLKQAVPNINVEVKIRKGKIKKYCIYYNYS